MRGECKLLACRRPRGCAAIAYLLINLDLARLYRRCFDLFVRLLLLVIDYRSDKVH